jgi:hypothetical protein
MEYMEYCGEGSATMSSSSGIWTDPVMDGFSVASLPWTHVCTTAGVHTAAVPSGEVVVLRWQQQGLNNVELPHVGRGECRGSLAGVTIRTVDVHARRVHDGHRNTQRPRDGKHGPHQLVGASRRRLLSPNSSAIEGCG